MYVNSLDDVLDPAAGPVNLPRDGQEWRAKELHNVMRRPNPIEWGQEDDVCAVWLPAREA